MGPEYTLVNHYERAFRGFTDACVIRQAAFLRIFRHHMFGFISRHQLLFYYNLTLSTDAPQGFRCLCAVILHGVLYILSPSVFFDSLLVSEFASTHH